MSQGHVIKAVYLRNLSSYFSGLLGYLFIIVYVVAGAFLAFTPQFFADNLANLDQLTALYPQLLLFLIPAITMSAWADEKKQGTDELLFTLPAKDWEILVGKYLAVLSVYTVALFFSFTHLMVLSYIGDPDWGVMFATYFGYWLSGAALLGAGMFASSLTGNTTVAFVLGAVMCAIPVFVAAFMNGVFGGIISVLDSIGAGLDLKTLLPEGGLFKEATISSHLQDFSLGMLPFEGLFYFLSIGGFFLYLNLIMIGRRHWAGGEQAASMTMQYTIRSIALAITLISVNSLIASNSGRFDLTSEGIYSLSPTTDDLIGKIGKDEDGKNIGKDDPKYLVTIQAFVSPQVPQEYVSVRKRLLGLLRQYDRLGGSRVDVRIVEVEPYSEAAEEAELYGIEPRQVQTERDGQYLIETVYLGAVVNSGYDEVVVPFFDVGTPVEYELTRSIRTASKKDRLTVGVLRTDARITGGFDMATFQSLPEWRIVRELKKQYIVEEVSPDQAIEAEKYDVLMAVMPSSLTQPQMDNLVNYVESGAPVLILDDPLPQFNPNLAPRNPKPAPQSNPMMGRQPPPEPKADNGEATSLTNLLQINWTNDNVLFDSDNPHPRFANQIPDEYIFISRKRSITNAFSRESEITDGLQEMLTVYAGEIIPGTNATASFTSLLHTSKDNSGVLSWDELVTPGPFGGMQLNRSPRRVVDEDHHAIAMRIERKKSDKHSPLNAIFVADVDLIADWMFNVVERRAADLELDNIVFILNAVDELAGDDDFLRLRKRRAKSRTLVRVENAKAEFVKSRTEAEEEARKDAEKELEEVQESFDKEKEKIQNDKSMDPNTKVRQLLLLAERTSRELAFEEQKINRERDQEIEKIKAQSERKIRTIENRVRFWSIIVPPIPAILMGIVVWLMRYTSERNQIADERRVQR